MAGDREDAGERTEEPTQQRREDFRRRGQVVQTRELASVFVLFGGAFCIWFFSRFIFEQLREIFVSVHGDKLVEAARNDDLKSVASFVFGKGVLMMLPVAAVSLVLGVMASILQVGFLVNEEAMQPNLDKISPVNGLRRMFSFRSIVEGLKSVLKVLLIIGTIAKIAITPPATITARGFNNS